MFSTKQGAARLLLVSVISLIILKALVSWITNSLSIIAQATDSLLDLVSGIITLAAVRAASKGEDEEHPYGHGKLEDFAGMGQGVLIIIAGIAIIVSSIERIISGAVVQSSELGIGVMIFSVVVSIFLSRHLRRVAREKNSIALEASANNIAADVYSASAVLAGLAILKFTGMSIIDPLLAIGVALYIFWIGYKTFRKPFSKLIDTKLTAEHEEYIKEALKKFNHEVVGYHRLRTRQAGDTYHIDLHIVMRKDLHIEDSHSICDRIEEDIIKSLPGSSVLIHVEPCNNECQNCDVICEDRKH